MGLVFVWFTLAVPRYTPVVPETVQQNDEATFLSQTLSFSTYIPPVTVSLQHTSGLFTGEKPSWSGFQPFDEFSFQLPGTQSAVSFFYRFKAYFHSSVFSNTFKILRL
jgi:hypothetical protein